MGLGEGDLQVWDSEGASVVWWGTTRSESEDFIKFREQGLWRVRIHTSGQGTRVKRENDRVKGLETES